LLLFCALSPFSVASPHSAGIALPPQATRLTGGIALSRALGDHLMKTPEQPTGLIAIPFVTPVMSFKAGHRLIVASDGLWDIGMNQMLMLHYFNFFLLPFVFAFV
jgi:serine/threonine protein phosphatase PrpC